MKLARLCYILIAAPALYINLLATPNFDLINGNPKVPIHVQANGGPWQILDQHHYRYPVTVPENNLLIMALSANNDKSAAISIIFSPEKSLDVAKRVGSSTTKAPTFYVTANIVTEKVPGSDKTIKHIQLAPQTSNGTSNQTKSGLSLENNVTQAMIDAIVAIASPEVAEQVEPKESWPAFATPKATEQKAHTPSKMSAAQPLQQQKEPSEVTAPSQQHSPMATIKPLQHTDTPQMILTKLKEMTDNPQTNARRTWTQICDYLTQQRTKKLFKGHDDAYIYKQLKDHYQTLADKTKSTLKKTYTDIVDIITQMYENAN